MTPEREMEIRDWFTGRLAVTNFLDNPSVMMSYEAYSGLHEFFDEVDRRQRQLAIAIEALDEIKTPMQAGDIAWEALSKIKSVSDD